VSVAEVLPAPDPLDARRALGAGGALAAFNAAGVLAAADVHVARRLMALAGTGDEAAGLAAALAVRAPRLGHVCADLATIRDTVAVEEGSGVDLAALPWPEVDAWVRGLASSPLVAVGEEGHPDRPLRLLGTRLYLDRYWRDERLVAGDLLERAGAPAEEADPAAVARLFPEEGSELPRLAAERALRRRLTVIAGGPGTGKTTTVARVLALLHGRAVGGPAPLIALAAPTGKAAARLQEAVHDEAEALDVSAAVRERLRAATASTLHRLLGTLPDRPTRFRHDRRNRLAHDVVVVDETSMVPLSLMARLLEAVRPAAHLILVGDPEQLASVEAGAVLGDIVGPAADPPPGATFAEGVVVLRRVHRFGGAIAALAEAVRAGDADAALGALRGSSDDLLWIPLDPDDAGEAALRPVREATLAAARRVHEAAASGRAAEALAALGAFRLLCAHRRGPHGVAAWTARVEGWLAAEVEGYAAEGASYIGRPLLVTRNDYGLRLYNGDTGVIVAGADGRPVAAFERAGELGELSPSRLEDVETVHAMTIHKGQGSQFDAVAVLLPEPGSPILTRELLYTAVTRARERLIVAGSEEAVRAAVERPIARASGLGERLWHR
jgi:exodeoxyribonuclease V alpha subunit